VTRALAALCTLLALALTSCSSSPPRLATTRAALTTTAPSPMRGWALAGAEFGVDPWGNGAIPGVYGTNYTYPTLAEAVWSKDKGATVVRLPVRIERLQPQAFGPLDATELGRVHGFTDGATALGLSVIIDPHNYARRGTALIQPADLASFWGKVAASFAGNPRVVFSVINEPHDMTTEAVVALEQAALNAIRGTGAKQLVLVQGNGWDGAADWSSTWYGTANAVAMLGIVDPTGGPIAYEVHQYLDVNGGNSPACVSATIGSERLSGFTSWLRANGRRGFLGEVGIAANATCMAALDDMLHHVEASADVWLGWTYWAAGPWWGTSWMAVEPGPGSVDAPQMAVLGPHLASAAAPPSPCPTCPACPAGTAPPLPPSPQPSGSPVRLMQLGNSITVPGAVRCALSAALSPRLVTWVGSQVDPYVPASCGASEGHAGWTIGNLTSGQAGYPYDVVATWVAAALPSHVLLMAGTNDVAWWSVESADQIADRAGALIDIILAAPGSPWVIVATIPPESTAVLPGLIPPRERSALARAFNLALVARVEARRAAGKRVRLADVAAVLTVADLYDGIHPNPASVTKVAAVWAAALAPTLP
jgi:endoglucanase